MTRPAITAAERQDIIAIGRHVRQLELAAIAERKVAASLFRKGRVVRASDCLAQAEATARCAADLKRLWQQAEGFREGYIL